MSPRTLRLVAAVLAVLTLGFALLQLFAGGIALRAHSYAMGALYCALGVAGCAIAQALWRARRRLG